MFEYIFEPSSPRTVCIAVIPWLQVPSFVDQKALDSPSFPLMNSLTVESRG